MEKLLEQPTFSHCITSIYIPVLQHFSPLKKTHSPYSDVGNHPRKLIIFYIKFFT